MIMLEASPDVLSFDIWNIVAVVINLIVFYFLLKKFLFGPILKILDQRQAKLDKINDETKKAHDEAMQMKYTYEDSLSKVNEESEQIIKNAKADAHKKYEKIVVSAQNESERLISDAHKSIELEKEHALKEAKADIVDLATQMAQKVISKKVDSADVQEVYDEFLNEVGDKDDRNGD